jgi:hypothetical protein
MSGWVEEALRINQRFLTEVVERFAICPFAVGARKGGHVERRVIVDRERAPAEAAARALQVELEPRLEIEVALIIFPRLKLDCDAFDAFCAPLRGATSVFASAVFHPEARYSDESADRLVGFFRRSPDPTLQLVRTTVLEAARGERTDAKFMFDFSASGWAELERRQSVVPLSERIARDNRATFLREGAARLQTIYDDICADRARSYARLASFGG